MGAKSQRKGRRGELQLAALLREHGFPVQAAEPLNYGTVPDLTGLSGIHIECKRAQALNLTAALEQARKDAERFRDGVPVVFWRKNRGKWVAFMSLESFMNLYQKANQQAAGAAGNGD